MISFGANNHHCKIVAENTVDIPYSVLSAIKANKDTIKDMCTGKYSYVGSVIETYIFGGCKPSVKTALKFTNMVVKNQPMVKLMGGSLFIEFHKSLKK